MQGMFSTGSSQSPAEDSVYGALVFNASVWHATHLVSVMLRLWQMTGLKFRMRGYRSMGLSVPLVMMTDWNLVNTGFMASDASRHASWITGSLTVGIRSSNGSVMICTAHSEVLAWHEAWLRALPGSIRKVAC